MGAGSSVQKKTSPESVVQVKPVENDTEISTDEPSQKEEVNTKKTHRHKHRTSNSFGISIFEMKY